jgi:hypothetical protein
MRALKLFPIICFVFLSACGGGGGGGEGGGPINSGTLGIERTFTCSGSQNIVVKILSNQESAIVTDASGGNARTFVRLGEEDGFVQFREGSTSLWLPKGVVDNPEVTSGTARFSNNQLNCTLTR